MKLRSDTPPAPKTDLHDREESLKHTLREQIAEIAAFLIGGDILRISVCQIRKFFAGLEQPIH